MIRFAARSLLTRRLATGLAVAGLVTASLGFMLLTAASRTTQAVLSGDVGRAWDAPYEILVRPTGSQSQLEQQAGLIRPNFLSGLNGGITAQQLESVRAIAGVVVAAPISVAGFTEWQTALPLALAEVADPSAELQLLRVRVVAKDTGAGSIYPPDAWQLVLYAPSGTVETDEQPSGAVQHFLVVGPQRIACDNLPDLGVQGPGASLPCFGGGTDADAQAASTGFAVDWPQPIVVAGIDPVAESALLGLDECIDSGRYLNENDRIITAGTPPAPAIPILASSRNYLAETLSVEGDFLALDPQLLEGGGAGLADAVIAWQPVAAVPRTPADAYAAYLERLASGASPYSASSLWTAGDVTYRSIAEDHLAAEAQPPDLTVFESTVGVGPDQEAPVRPEALDTWFRPIDVHRQLRRDELFPRWSLTGTFDPECLPAFDPLVGYRLETYSVPQVSLPDGGVLGPSRNMAGYVNTPPLVLTPLAGAAYLADATRFDGAAGAAFISAIRVKVSGVDQPTGASQAKLARIAGEIQAATGLQVDIVVGSSPRQIEVDLPGGAFGRPALTVEEGWAVKGVAVQFVEALRLQDLAIFSIVLVVAAILIGETAYIAVRRRRAEFGVLRALGWPAWRIGTLVELEMLGLGLISGMMSLVVAVPLARALGVDLSAGQLFGVLPLAVSLALVGGLIPAMLASRGTPLHVIAGQPPRSGVRPVSVVHLAVGDLVVARRSELVLGVIAAALAALLIGGVVLASRAFAATLDATILGVYLSIRVQPFHWLIGFLVSAVAIVGIAQTVMLNYLERQVELATLRALGWPRSALVSYLLAQALAMGGIGGVLAATGTLLLGLASEAAPVLILGSCLFAFVAAVVLSALAAAGPMIVAFRAPPAASLRGE